ncbi:hypothetical protein SAMN05444008_112165 [Cnuella takakiae]|uniref:Uncharacterized protein n=1 Tax=Cnuella takakiae TaxID=1302690 RepID=A0A1M5ES74_9BACT|nr:hypothetical protein SAMN05444008_112165 [Cnuella takakiae]
MLPLHLSTNFYFRCLLRNQWSIIDAQWSIVLPANPYICFPDCDFDGIALHQTYLKSIPCNPVPLPDKVILHYKP